MSFILVIAKIIGFYRQIFLAQEFGATITTDLINMSNNFVCGVVSIFSSTAATAIVATYVKISDKDKTKGDRLISDILKIVAVGGCLLVAVFVLAAPLLSRLLAPSYSDELSSALTFYLRVQSPLLLLFCFSCVFDGLLNSHKIFVPGQLASIFYSAFSILAVVFLKDVLGPDTIVVGFVSYAVVFVLFMAVYSGRFWKPVKGDPLKNPDVIGLFKIVAPLALGYAMIAGNQLVDRIIVSGMDEGVLTSMTYAVSLVQLIVGLIEACCTVLFSHITAGIAANDEKGVASIALDAMTVIIFILLPVSVITVMCSQDICQVAFGRGEFDAVAVRNTGIALMGYGFMFVPYAVKTLFSRFCYGHQDTRRPMINAAIAIAINIILSISLSSFWGVLGVTVATSIAEVAAAALNMRSSQKHSKHVKYKTILIKLPYWLLGGVLCVIAVKVTGGIMAEKRTFLRLIVSAGAGFAGYIVGVMPWIFKNRSLITTLFKRRGNREGSDGL